MVNLKVDLGFLKQEGARMRTICMFVAMGIFLTLLMDVGIGNAQTSWERYEGNPVLEPIEGTWEDKFYGDGGVAVIFNAETDTYEMWYTGYVESTYTYRIGFATSSDGVNWERYSNNPLELPTDPMLESTRNPTVIYDSDAGIYHMWYRVKLLTGGERYAICYATSIDGINWSDSLNVVLEPRQGEWDSLFYGYPTVVLNDDTLKMWYLGWAVPFEYHQYGYAYSLDGVHWEGRIPITGLDSLDMFLNVVADGDTLRMWYNSMADSGIGYAWSTDGVVWHPYESNPVITRGTEPWDGPAMHSVIKQGDTYKMWYVGNQDLQATSSGIGLATSPAHDFFPLELGNSWYFGGDDAGYFVLTDTIVDTDTTTGYSGLMYSGYVYEFGAPDSSSIAYYEWQGYIYRFEQGIWCKKNMQVGDWWYELADSTIHTVVAEESISVPAGNFQSMKAYWEPNIYNDGEFDWFVDQVGLVKTMYWEGSDTSISVLDSAVVNGIHYPNGTSIPEEQGDPFDSPPINFLLLQNYPNPFNPLTEIRYWLPEECWVRLEVYNILGQKVATVIDGKQKAEYKVARWDASPFSSGIYFYRLQAGDFVETKKMILLK